MEKNEKTVNRKKSSKISIELEEIDIQCVKSLAKDPVASWRQLSKDSGVPEKTVARRIKKLMDQHVLRVVGECDPLMLKKGVVVHVWLECELGMTESVALQLASFVDSRLVVALAGASDLMAEFYFDDVEQLLDLTVSTLPHVAGIRQFDVSMVLQSFKRASQWQMTEMLPEKLKVTLSEQERQLVELLMQDGRANLNVLATHLGISEPTAFRMMQALTDSGVLRFRVDIEPKLMGYAAEAIVCLEVNPNHLTMVAQALSKHPNTRCLFGTSGRSQLFWHVLCEDNVDLWPLMSEDLGGLEGISRINMNMINQAFKRCGAIRPV